ncbi:hypothetical protein PENDEC_c020G06352 [Penicillium decumbens]|uniref:Conidiation-specific protein 10 n=1 Tax=Penicillium decumbens TaxID=69771 RepID=A0A1V6P6F6_PENDC|nr:hypothetical protein PENDEC_c020G06352 [Penicillium decumbens]
MPSKNPNPGNFANRPHEDVSRIAQQGGRSSHKGGFAGMDPSKQREIASHGGSASGGSFHPGDERAREAGRKGGHASGGKFQPGDERAKEAGHKGGLSGPSE